MSIIWLLGLFGLVIIACWLVEELFNAPYEETFVEGEHGSCDVGGPGHEDSCDSAGGSVLPRLQAGDGADKLACYPNLAPQFPGGRRMRQAAGRPYLRIVRREYWPEE